MDGNTRHLSQNSGGKSSRFDASPLSASPVMGVGSLADPHYENRQNYSLCLLPPKFPILPPIIAFSYGGETGSPYFIRTHIATIAKIKEEVAAHVVKCLEKAGMKVVHEDSNREWTLLFGRARRHELKQLTPYQLINRVPGTSYIHHRDKLFDMLNSKRSSPNFSNLFPFILDTYVLPKDYHAFRKAFREREPNSNHNKYWIVKGQCSNRQVRMMLSDLRQLERFTECIAQRFLMNPLVVEGKRMDVRAYALITCIQPLEIYIWRGKDQKSYFQRFPDSNRQKFPEIENQLEGCGMWTLGMCLSALQQASELPSSPSVLKAIKSAVARAICASVPYLTAKCENLQLNPCSRNFFELLCFDFLLDTQGNAFMLDAHSCAYPPSPTMMRDLFTLIGIVPQNEHDAQAPSQSQSTRPHSPASEVNIDKDIALIQEGNIDDLSVPKAPQALLAMHSASSRSGGFEMIMPAAEVEPERLELLGNGGETPPLDILAMHYLRHCVGRRKNAELIAQAQQLAMQSRMVTELGQPLQVSNNSPKLSGTTRLPSVKGSPTTSAQNTPSPNIQFQGSLNKILAAAAVQANAGTLQPPASSNWLFGIHEKATDISPAAGVHDHYDSPSKRPHGGGKERQVSSSLSFHHHSSKNGSPHNSNGNGNGNGNGTTSNYPPRSVSVLGHNVSASGRSGSFFESSPDGSNGQKMFKLSYSDHSKRPEPASTTANAHSGGHSHVVATSTDEETNGENSDGFDSDDYGGEIDLPASQSSLPDFTPSGGPTQDLADLIVRRYAQEKEAETEGSDVAETGSVVSYLTDQDDSKQASDTDDSTLSILERAQKRLSQQEQKIHQDVLRARERVRAHMLKKRRMRSIKLASSTKNAPPILPPEEHPYWWERNMQPVLHRESNDYQEVSTKYPLLSELLEEDWQMDVHNWKPLRNLYELPKPKKSAARPTLLRRLASLHLVFGTPSKK